MDCLCRPYAQHPDCQLHPARLGELYGASGFVVDELPVGDRDLEAPCPCGDPDDCAHC